MEYTANIVTYGHNHHQYIDKYQNQFLLAASLKFVNKVISAKSASYDIDTVYIMLYYMALHCIVAHYNVMIFIRLFVIILILYIYNILFSID